MPLEARYNARETFWVFFISTPTQRCLFYDV